MPLVRAVFTAASGLLSLALVVPASAGIVAQIDQSRQRMRVYVDGALSHDWPVSTARNGYVTPNGNFRVGLMAPM
ncbi:L,D-transpeptidase [Methylobacterium sp. WL6]|uniref:L,D-transpeptidase n=1 Tax=Methylobacterium sp. WL6 TaxID=2603901 RepID=UPI0032B2D5EA